VKGQFPGDGEPKPLPFPVPRDVGEVIEGICYIKLPRLIELKLASGMANPGRLNDLGDVQEVIHELQLPTEFGAQLNPRGQAKYHELWRAVTESPGQDDL
jgi:hypothetical protein